MKRSKNLLWILMLLLTAFLFAGAQVNKEPRQRQQQPAAALPEKYRMELVYIFEGPTTEFIYVIGNVGFKSVDSLKKFVGSLPPGTVLEWAPGCRRMGNEPLLSSEKEMEDFRSFCAARKINFVLIPSG